ncbi:uncharacterized protein LOC127732904 [Mytilus californianus]|uniref:uncharacterized protein LOC127732904 n=1 Tax=Mytilus californianus TaxID=6549 RepID=UPI0022482215|nr:uncharacterized protein LOC127732904 [Mytilus californianus]
MGAACSSEPEYKHIPHSAVIETLHPSDLQQNPAIVLQKPHVDKKVKFDQDTEKKEKLDTAPKMDRITPGKAPPKRTISVLKQMGDDERLKRNPEIKEFLTDFINVRVYIEKILNKDECVDDEYEELHKMLTEKIIEPFNKQTKDEGRLLMGDHLAKIGFVKPLVELYDKILEEHDIHEGISPSLDDDDGEQQYYIAIVDIRSILWNFSDTSKDFGMSIAQNTDFFQSIVKDLKITFKEGLENLSAEEFSFNSAVAITTNCGRAGVQKSNFKVEVIKKDNSEPVYIHMVDVLTPFLKSKEQFVKLTTLLALSYMVNEDQNRFLTADLSLFDFLLEMIKLAMKDKDRRYSGFSVHELVEGLAGLAKNDENKLKIMEKKDTYPLLKKSIMQNKAEQEQLAAVRAVWELSFVEKNKKILAKDKDLMSKLESLQKHDNQDIANSAGRALFVINPDNEKNLMKSVDDSKSKLEHPEQEHIMISYQWSNQKTILQIKDKLRQNNFPVWIDVDFMEGSMLQMMASAIEKASVVLICYSEKYKDSKNCRTEAEYAFARDKMIIPVLLQNRYRPDGWLGILIGSKKFYDFSGKYDFEKKFLELRGELEGQLLQKKRQPAIMKDLVNQVVNDYEDVTREIGVLSWTKQDLENWLKQNQLEAFSSLHSLTGEQIGFLYKLFRRAPDFFYKCLEEKLGLKSLEDLMKFDKALEKLSRDHPEINKLL